MRIVINNYNLKIKYLTEFISKVKAILIDNNNNILLGNYNGTLLLPGGKIEGNETFLDAMIRELKEETGVIYSYDDLSFFGTVDYYQKDYPFKGSYKNRFVFTCYFVGKFKGIDCDNMQLSDCEIKNNFNLELIPLDNIENTILFNPTKNPYNRFQRNELLKVISAYKNENKLCRKRK